MTSNQVCENCQLEKSHWRPHGDHGIYHFGLNQHSIFTFHYFNAKLLGKYSQTPVWQLGDSCQIFDLINFKTTWLDLPTLLKSVYVLGWNTVKLITGMLKSLHSLGSCAENFLLIQISSISSVIFTRLWPKCHIECFDGPAAPQQAMLGALIVWWLILITMDNGRGHCWILAVL